MTKAHKALQIARELAQEAKSATDLHNAFFGIGGRFAELFPTRAEREAFAKTPEYQEILRLRSALPRANGRH
jgi:phage anti-repressor protein